MNNYSGYPGYMACQSANSGGGGGGGGSNTNTSGMNQTGVYNNQNIVQAFHQVNTVQHVQMQGGQLQIMQQQYQYVQQGQGVGVNGMPRPSMMPAGGVVPVQGQGAVHGQVMPGPNAGINNINMMQQGMNMGTAMPNTIQQGQSIPVQGQPMNIPQQQGGGGGGSGGGGGGGGGANFNVMGGQYHLGHGYGVMGPNQVNAMMAAQQQQTPNNHCNNMITHGHHPQQQQKAKQKVVEAQAQVVSGNMLPEQQQQAILMSGAMQGNMANMTMIPVGAKMAPGSPMPNANMGGGVGVGTMCGAAPAGTPVPPLPPDTKNFMLVVPFGWRREVDNGQVVYIR
ncbi:hypothetical protein Pcinc_039755 [Petrolisthes cinctipes]|uniref:Uncharacterized protein n=1 Tax=Petrolisthes cinctipes TaxID=88211 RepID=A0AAE1BNI7_PETCI|nr:hypothetical protein Pcinc_039755 [Petrolisthes cinctipes]